MNVWRDGNCIVIHRFGQFPDRCIITNDFAHHYVKQSVTFPEPQPNATKRATRLALKHLIPGLAIVMAFASVGAGAAQARLPLRIRLSDSAFRTYQQRQWQVIGGTILAVTIGFMAFSLILSDRFSTNTTAFLGIIGFTLIFAGLFGGIALWVDRRQLVVMKRAEQGYLWLSLGNRQSDYVRQLPAWDDRFFQQVIPPEPPPRQGWRSRLPWRQSNR